jgi:hypothetical protein
MNHRPFEDWLLDDQPLTPEQTRQLQSHLRDCAACATIAESNLALHSTRQLPPAAGFVDRFQARLEAHRRELRWRQMVGTVVLVLAGLGLLSWLAGPLVQEALRSPAQWITTVVSYFLFILTSVQALSEVGSILLRVLPKFVSPFGWFIISMMVAGLGFLWTVSIWRFVRIPRGV